VLEQFVFESILLFLSEAGAGQSIQVFLKSEDSGPVIEIKGQPAGDGERLSSAALADLARELRCQVEIDNEAGSIRLALGALET
jgi:hypothetical protein